MIGGSSNRGKPWRPAASAPKLCYSIELAAWGTIRAGIGYVDPIRY